MFKNFGVLYQLDSHLFFMVSFSFLTPLAYLDTMGTSVKLLEDSYLPEMATFLIVIQEYHVPALLLLLFISNFHCH